MPFSRIDFDPKHVASLGHRFARAGPSPTRTSARNKLNRNKRAHCIDLWRFFSIARSACFSRHKTIYRRELG
jgi:hypothetical protein